MSNFNKHNKVKIMTHGWLGGGFGPWPKDGKNAYLNVADVNVIIVDWSKHANCINYAIARNKVPQVGIVVAKFLDFLASEGVFMDDVHLIGYSLGAHIMGIAGLNAREGIINTITGLDPAWPLFMMTAENCRLSQKSAKLVEVIHTNSGHLGFLNPLGHIDFYPNGGKTQPGCDSDCMGYCAHKRAYLYFIESLTSLVPFTAVKCYSYFEIFWYSECEGTGQTLDMGGLESHHGHEGVYYLKTNAESPFVIGDVCSL